MSDELEPDLSPPPLPAKKTMDKENENKPKPNDEEIRQDQWKNCLGCVVSAVILVIILLFALKQCSQM